MQGEYFSHQHFPIIGEALKIAEEKVSDYYKLSYLQWVSHPYEVITLREYPAHKEPEPAFAILKKVRVRDKSVSIERYLKDLYLICLQDHLILKALGKDYELQLFPLLLYIFTHELIHIVRFSRFHQRYDLDTRKRTDEEKVVHSMTADLLKDISLSGINYIINCYKDNNYYHIM